MADDSVVSVTRLLTAWRGGDHDAFDRLVALLYRELQKLARAQLRGERPSHTLQTTAVVHEAYIRLVAQQPEATSRGHFFGLAAHVMRQVLIDHARRRKARKRGAGCVMVTLSGVEHVADRQSLDVIALDDALSELSLVDPRQSRIVELRFFGGLTIDETAATMELSSATVRREWTMAKAWLHDRLSAR